MSIFYRFLIRCAITRPCGIIRYQVKTVGVIKKVHRKCKRKCIESIKESNKEISPVRLDVLSGIGYNTYTIFERSI